MVLSLVLVLAVGCESQEQQQPVPQDRVVTEPAPFDEPQAANDVAQPADDGMGDMDKEPQTAPTPTPSAPTPGATSFVLTGENFKFVMDGKDAPELRVKEGDTVRIEFTSSDGFHDWVVDEFNAHTQKVRPGTPTAVEFVASKKGTFEYYCSVGSHRQQGMKGNLIVE